MNSIRLAGPADLLSIHQLAHQIWWPAYRDILPQAQIEKMLAEFYTQEALAAQVASGHHFALYETDSVPLGFVSFRVKKLDSLENISPSSSTNPASSSTTGIADPTEKKVMRVEKLYVSPHTQGSGAGTQLLEYVARTALAQGIQTLELNLNRENPAVGYYHKKGFSIIAEVDIPYGEYILNDYIMQKKISTGQFLYP